MAATHCYEEMFPGILILQLTPSRIFIGGKHYLGQCAVVCRRNSRLKLLEELNTFPRIRIDHVPCRERLRLVGVALGLTEIPQTKRYIIL